MFRASRLQVKGAENSKVLAFPTLECRYCKALSAKDGRPFRWHPRTPIQPRVCVRCKREDWDGTVHGPHVPGHHRKPKTYNF